MKILPFVFICVALVKCKPENTTPTKPATTSSFDATKATLLKNGMFVTVSHGSTTGTVSLYDQAGIKFVVFDPFLSPSGPDLKVYLSKDVSATDYIRIGKLQSTMGRQVYAVPGTPLIKDYHYIHIWCEAFSVEFAHAEVK